MTTLINLNAKKSATTRWVHHVYLNQKADIRSIRFEITVFGKDTHKEIKPHAEKNLLSEKNNNNNNKPKKKKKKPSWW